MTIEAALARLPDMQHLPSRRRISLITLAVLSACAVADAPASASTPPSGSVGSTGVYGDYLRGRFALSQAEPGLAAHDFLQALAVDPGNHGLMQQAFLASALAGRSAAVQLARQLPDNQVAPLVLGDQAAATGNWQAAARYFNAVPRRGLTQLLQPLLVAWAQQGAGDTDAALATLQPLVNGPRFRGIFTLHAAMIADLAGRAGDAARLYAAARSEMPEMNLRLAQVLASWDARSGDPQQAHDLLASLAQSAPELGVAVPGLARIAAQRPVTQATDGIAESYLALAAALRAQQSNGLAMVMVRLALDLRPDFTAARLLGAAVLADDQHNAAALQMLAGVPNDDPLYALVQLRRAGLNQRLGRVQSAMRSLKQVAVQHPDSIAPLMMEGDILRSQQRFQEAVGVYTHAIDDVRHAGPADWVLYYSRGISYQQSGQWPKAEADFRHALQLSPHQAVVQNYLGYSWAERGEHLAEAQHMIQQALLERPNDGAITDSFGWVMLRQGHIGDAVEMLQRAAELDPEDSTINAHLGDAYWAAGRKLEAQYQWRRALTLNPAPGDVAKLEAKLRIPPKAAVISGQ